MNLQHPEMEQLEETARLGALREEIWRALIQTTPVAERLQHCAEAVVRHLDAAFARIWTLDQDARLLQLEASAGFYTHLDGKHSRIPLGSFKIGRIAESRLPHLTNDIQTDPEIDDHAWATREGMVAFAGYPLLVQEQVVGVLALFARHPLDASALDALAANASRIALSIKRDRMENSLRASEAQYRHIFQETADGMVISNLEGIVVQANRAFCQMYGYSQDAIIGMHPETLLAPAYHHLVPGILQSVRGGQRFETEAICLRSDGTPFYVEIQGNAFVYLGQPHILTVVRDITQRVENTQLLARLLEERTREIEQQQHVTDGLRGIMAAVNSNRPLDEILQYIVAEACRLAGTDAASLFFLDEATQTLWIKAAQGLPHELVAQLKMPVGVGATGKAVAERRPVLQPNINEITQQVDELMEDSQRRQLILAGGKMATMAVPLIVRGQVYGAIDLHYDRPHQFTEEEIQLAASFADQAALAIDNARLNEQARELAAREARERVARELHESVQRRQVAEGLRSILEVVNSSRPLNEILHYVVAEACRLCGTDTGALYLLDEPQHDLRIEASQGLPAEFAAQIRIPVGVGATGNAVIHRRPFLIESLKNSTQIVDGLLDDPNRRALIGMVSKTALIAVPLVVREQIYGAIALYYDDPHPFSEEEIQLAVSFAAQAALAIENARLHERARQLAALEERQRLARELHDSVSQALYGIALGARTARVQLERDPANAIEPLDYVLSLADAGLAEMRALIFELRPESLESEGLVAALAKQCDSLHARHHIEVQTYLGREPSVSLAVKETLYRVAQEATQNIAKHAHATRVEVRLKQTKRALRLEIRDDGAGFDPTESYPGHLGLQSMRERVERLHGKIHFESAPAQGTSIQIEIPVDK